MKQKQTLTVLILMMCLGITSCGQPAQTTQSQAPASTATQTPASPSATRIPSEPTPDPSSMDTIDLYEYDSIDPAKGDTLAGDDFLKKCSDGDCLVVNENVKKILPATPKQSTEESDSNMVDLLLLRTSDLDVESIVNLLDFASPDDIVWFDHGKRKYYSILDDKLGDFFKDYLPDFKPKNGFLIYKGTLLYYYGNAKDIVIPNSVKKIAENAFSKNEDKVKLNRIVIPDSVKEIKSFAFSGRRVKTMIFGKGIRKIEECSLCDTIDTLIFQGKTDKILKNGFDELFSEDFDDDTTLEFPNDFSESFTLCYADVTPSGSKKNPESVLPLFWDWMISEEMPLLPECMHILCSVNIRRQRSHFPVHVFVRSLTMIRSIRWTCMKHSCCRLSARIVCLCHFPVSPFRRVSARECVTA